MPNFWTGLGRMMAGKPIYNPDDPDIKRPDMNEWKPGDPPVQQSDPNQWRPGDPPLQTTDVAQPYAPVSSIIKGDDRTFPRLEVRRVDNRYQGDNVEVFFRIYNPTNMELWIERVKACGQDRRIRDNLMPRQEHQYSVYKGHVFKDKRERDVDVIFKTMDGDYFNIKFEIRHRYIKEHDMFEVDEVHQHHAVRDIYEGY